MRETAYYLITLDRRTPAEVAREVRRLQGILEAAVTLGDFDIIAVAQMDGTKAFPDLAAQLRGVQGITKVTTCVVVRP